CCIISGMEYQHYSTLPKLGRPKKFETVEDLENQILEYFRSCFTPLTKRKRVKDPETGIIEYVDVPQKDGNGEQLFAQVRPFTVTGLAVALDTTRETLLDYENKPENAAFSDTIKKAKQRIQQYAEDYLFSGKNPTGAIFNLKN